MTFNWTLGGDAGAAQLDASTYELLANCGENRTLEPRDPSSEAILEFQESVRLLRAAHEQRLIDAWFSPPSRSPRHRGAIVFVVVNAILPRGEERLRGHGGPQNAASAAAAVQ